MAAMPILRGIRKGAMLDDESATNELLVFGYSCKLFRDDDKATYIDQGKHLIPWMGNAGHMIDRYDGRGYIHDLGEYEPVAGRGDPWDELSPEQRHLEDICDEERYLALKGNPEETDLYHEEEIKRLKAALDDDSVYNEVGFTYDEAGSTGAALHGWPKSEILNDENNSSSGFPDATFVAAKELNVPPEMQLPASGKENAIIERTALFVVRQGAQMEILIKAKQASNPQFAFLAFDHPLNPYYRHVINAVKQGKYVPKPPAERNDGMSGDEDDDDDADDGHYLHPSLMATKEEELNVPKLNYTWTSDDPYSLLVSRLKDKVEMDAKKNLPAAPSPPPPQPPPPAVIQAPVVAAPHHQIAVLLRHRARHPPPPPLLPPPPPGLEPVTLPAGSEGVAAAVVDPTMQIVVPPSDVVPIIDKMASYVAKNGDHFEAVVKSKSLDARFAFLAPGHVYHAYYLFKRRQFVDELPKSRGESMNASRAPSADDNSSPDAELKSEASTNAVVSFSIKLKEGGEKRRTFSDTLDGSLTTVTTTMLPTPPTSIEQLHQQLQQQTPKELTEDEKRLKAKLEEAKQAEKRIRDKLAAAARERLAQVSREKQLQLERKRKAALFLTMLRKGKGQDGDTNTNIDAAGMIGPRLPTTVEMTQLIMREDSPPILALVAAQVESMSASKSRGPGSTTTTTTTRADGTGGGGASAETSGVRERRRSRSPHPDRGDGGGGDGSRQRQSRRHGRSRERSGSRSRRRRDSRRRRQRSKSREGDRQVRRRSSKEKETRTDEARRSSRRRRRSPSPTPKADRRKEVESGRKRRRKASRSASPSPVASKKKSTTTATTTSASSKKRSSRSPQHRRSGDRKGKKKSSSTSRKATMTMTKKSSSPKATGDSSRRRRRRRRTRSPTRSTRSRSTSDRVRTDRRRRRKSSKTSTSQSGSSSSSSPTTSRSPSRSSSIEEVAIVSTPPSSMDSSMTVVSCATITSDSSDNNNDNNNKSASAAAVAVAKTDDAKPPKVLCEHRDRDSTNESKKSSSSRSTKKKKKKKKTTAASSASSSSSSSTPELSKGKSKSIDRSPSVRKSKKS